MEVDCVDYDITVDPPYTGSFDVLTPSEPEAGYETVHIVIYKDNEAAGTVRLYNKKSFDRSIMKIGRLAVLK